MRNIILGYTMLIKKVLIYCMLGSMVFLGGLAVFVHAWYIYAEKREVLLTTSLKIEGQEQKFKAFYLSAPVDWFEVEFNVSKGSVKFSVWDANLFEDSLGWFDYHNGTAVERLQVWLFEGNNGTAGFGGEGGENMVWYIHFYNEDSYEKEVQLQVTKIWK
jgi:hypothetical protein